MTRKPRNERKKHQIPTPPEGDFEEDAERKRDDDDGEDSAQNGHNARLAAIDAGHEKFLSLQAEEDRLMEKWIEPIRKKKQKIKADLKSEYDVPTDAFNARQAMLRIERRGDDYLVAALNEQFQATPLGKNMDMVAVMKRADEIRAERAQAKEDAKTKVKEGVEEKL